MSKPNALKPVAVLVALGVLLGVAAAGRLYVGSAGVGWPDELLLKVRAYRLMLGLLVGSSLAVSGVALQTLLRNPLAEPYILGLSTGAGAGMMLQALLLHWFARDIGSIFVGSQFGALIGAGASMAVVFLASRRRGMIDPLGLLLTGVVLSTINGALIMLFNYAAGPSGLREEVARWMMGYLNEGTTLMELRVVAVVSAAVFVVVLLHAKAMDVATVSDTEAQSLGVNLARLRVILFAAASLLAAGAVVLAGPIAFVGLISPHIGRALLGPRHLSLLIGSAVIGATLIVLADIASSAIALRFEIGLMPIGIFTAMIGGPAFLWMLRPQLGRTLD